MQVNFLEKDLPFPAVAIRFSSRLIFSAPSCRNCCGDVFSSSYVSFALPSYQTHGCSWRLSDERQRADGCCLTFYDSLMARWDIRFYWCECSQPVVCVINKWTYKISTAKIIWLIRRMKYFFESLIGKYYVDELINKIRMTLKRILKVFNINQYQLKCQMMGRKCLRSFGFQRWFFLH